MVGSVILIQQRQSTVFALFAINNLDEQVLRMDACAKLGLNKQNKHNGAGFYNNLTMVNSHVHLGFKR